MAVFLVRTWLDLTKENEQDLSIAYSSLLKLKSI